jgi:hypothetical protein
MHGGRIEARSDESGRGSAFVVHLPVVDEACSAQPYRAGDAVGHTVVAAPRIHVVDGERMVAKCAKPCANPPGAKGLLREPRGSGQS